MISLKESIHINAPAEFIYKVISDFKNYPKFYPEVESAELIRKEGNEADVEFKVNIVISSHYTLRFNFKKREIKWKMVECSSYIKKNEGKWLFERLSANKTKVIFETEMEFSWLVPSQIGGSIIESHVPKILANLKKQSEKIYKKDARRNKE
jgi:ribosome-associated toxin RatA of RatAB toxin-antitoxin module